MNKELTRKIIDIFDSGIDNVREFRDYTFKFLGKNHPKDWITAQWDHAWGSDDHVKDFVKSLTDDEKRYLMNF